MTVALMTLALGTAALSAPAGGTAGASALSVAPTSSRPAPGKIKLASLSTGARAWFNGPQAVASTRSASRARIALGTNVDAADPNEDLAAGQAETAVAAAGSTVVTGWNDATGFLVQPSTDRRASLTGLGVSTDRGRHIRDLVGLRNNQPNQQWFGDPTVVAVNASTFIVGSLYFPSTVIDCSPGHQARLQLAVEVLTLSATGAATLGLPVVSADGGDVCSVTPSPGLAIVDKAWLSYDRTTRTLAMSYTRFFFGIGGQSGTGQIETVRAHLPSDPRSLTAADWSSPITVWPEEPATLNEGAYVSVASNGDCYLSWERNVNSNLVNGDPFVYIHAARVRAGAVAPIVGGPAFPRIVTLGQRNSNGAGGVKSLDAVVIAGFNRGTGQDFPRIAVNPVAKTVIVVWNDASAHPLGDIWMRALPLNLSITAPIRKVNGDNSFALHFLPAVSVRANGAIATSWYDRRLTGPDSSRTDYFGEVRSSSALNATDFRISTGSTDWANTSTLSTPNFGDYTDNASTATTTYFSWTDGRIGVPQPFVDSH
ncbi:MAG: hypothetical protein QOI26_2665 [Pseudonocardiales bacterium]|nr:hypothetical protein [Pseudonocardiales bacterium]